MDVHYEPLWHDAMQLKHQTQDMINDHNHPMAQVLHHETTQLVDDIEMNRTPRAIEDRVKQIQRQLVQARAQGEGVINYTHNEGLHHSYTQMRDRIRNMPHY